jgi:prevent-host-death family protein
MQFAKQFLLCKGGLRRILSGYDQLVTANLPQFLFVNEGKKADIDTLRTRTLPPLIPSRSHPFTIQSVQLTRVEGPNMRQAQWRLQTAKAQLSELVEAALRGEPQRITRCGKDVVMVCRKRPTLH